MKHNIEVKPEYRDLFDKQRNFIGKTSKRGEPIPKDTYHLVVGAWILDDTGRFLIQRRAMECDWLPGVWGVPGGGAISGEDSLTAAIREAKEEVGILLDPKNAEFLCGYKQDNVFFDHWLFTQHFDLAEVTLQAGETMDARAASWDDIYNMKESGNFIGRKVLRHWFDPFDLLKDRLSQLNLPRQNR